MCAVLGIVLAFYVAVAVMQNEVVVGTGMRMRTVRRPESPIYYCVCIGIYALLAVALLTVF